MDMIYKVTLRVLVYILLVVVTVSATVSCSMLFGISKAKGELKITSYAESVDEDTLGDDSNIKPVIHVEPAIGGMRLFVGNQTGLIHITDVPEGTYTIHPLHLPDTYDVLVDVAPGEVTTRKIIIPQSGLVYCVINTDSTVEELADSDVRMALAQAVDRNAVLDSFSSDETPALNLLPALWYHDGLNGLTDVDVSSVEDPGLDSPFSFNLLYNETPENQSVAQTLESQWEALSFVSEVSGESQDWNTYLNSREGSSLHTARAGWLLDSNNILIYFQKLIEQSRYEDAALTQLINTAQSALDSDQVDEYTSTLVLIHDHLIEHMVVIPLYYYER